MRWRFAKIAIGVFIALAIGSLLDISVFAAQKAPTYKIVAYLPLWENWQANDIDTKKLTHIILAFAGVKNGVIVDPLSPEQVKFLKRLKRENRQLKILISLGGGGGGAAAFSDAALTADSRQKFAASVTNFISQHQLDGVDIDWELPVSGSSETDKGRPEDKENFTLMMQTLRTNLDDAAKAAKKQYLLTFAAIISSTYLNNIETDKLFPVVDFINLMTYDFHGPWEQVTGFHTNLYTTPEDPAGLSADDGVKRYLKIGVPPEKIILGTAFYGYGWSGVTNANNGRYQPANGKSKSYSYQTLAANYINRNGYLRFWDDQAKAPYLWNGDTFITYEDEESLNYRAIYIRANQLGGVMIWQYCHDMSGTLLNRLYQELNY